MSLKFVAGIASVAVTSASLTAPDAEYVSASAVKVEVPSIPYCPDGSVYDASLGCAHIDYAEPKGECPHPYKLDKSSGACVATTVGASTLSCPSGSYLENKTCVTDVTTPVEISCVKGEISKDGCVVYSEPVVVADEVTPVKLSCSTGYKLNGDICVKETSTAGDLACAEGTLAGGKCITYTTAGKFCSKNGYTLVGDDCIQVTVAYPSFKCPAGSSAGANGACLTKVTADPVKVCEKGYTYNSSKDTCEAQVLITAVLNGVTNKDNNIKVDCRLGSIGSDGNCYQTYTSPAVNVCDKDFELVGKKCVTYVEVNPEPKCNAGYTLNPTGTECVATSTLKASCPAGYTNSADAKGTCTKKISEAAAIVCPKGYNLNDKSKCTVLEAVQPSVSCKKGSDYLDGACVVPGYVKAGSDKYYDFTYSCPKGYTLDKAEMICRDEISADAQVVCDKGFTLVGKKCIATFSTAAQLMCPKNYSFDGSKDGNLCQRVSYSRPVFKCPEDTISSGQKCYVYSDANSSSDVHVTYAPINKKGTIQGSLRRI